MEELEQPVIPESTPEPEGQPLFGDVDDEPVAVEETPAPVEIDDSEEIDHEGEKYKVPKKLKDAFLRQADYTVKTQDLAKQFQKLDWNALTDADPVQALKLDRQMRELQQQRAQQVDGLQQSQARQAFESQQAIARRHEEARVELSKEIPGFGTPEVQKQLIEVGKAAGYKQEELANVLDPRAIKLLHKAHLYDQLVSKAKASAPASEAIKPITRVAGANAATQKSIGDASLSDAEYNRMRREYIARNR